MCERDSDAENVCEHTKYKERMNRKKRIEKEIAKRMSVCVCRPEEDIIMDGCKKISDAIVDMSMCVRRLELKNPTR